MAERRDNIEVRLHNDGTLDEALLYDETGQLVFHMEQMDDHYFWMRLYGTTTDLVIHVDAVVGEVTEFVIDKGIIVGEKKVQGPKVDANYEWEEAFTEKECEKRFASPDPDRRRRVAELVNKYGVGVLLDEIADLISIGRNAEHDVKLVGELRDIKDNFVDSDKTYWNEKIR